MKTKNNILLICGILVIAVLAVLVWWNVGKHNAIHAEMRTVHMTEIEATLDGAKLTGQELLPQAVTSDGVTLQRVVYYPQAETLLCFFSKLGAYQSITLGADSSAAASELGQSFGVSTVVFEGVTNASKAGSIEIHRDETTGAQFESLSFTLGSMS